MEPDFSILRKTGHFYFALTRYVLVHTIGETFENQDLPMAARKSG